MGWGTSSRVNGVLSWRGLRVRLLLTVILVLVLTAVISAWFASETITSGFEVYIAREEALRRESIVGIQNALTQLLTRYYVPESGWVDDIQNVVEEISRNVGYRVVLSDADGSVIADSSHLTGTIPAIEESAYLRNGETVFGVVTVYLVAEPTDRSSELAFIESVNRSLLLAVAISGMLAVVLILVFMHPVVTTLEALTAAANQMTGGDLNQRVAVKSKDEIGQLAYAFNRMADSLNRIETVRRNMVTDIAHELRTPLSNIRGYMEALRDGVILPDTMLFDSLHKEALILSRLVEDLQELSLAEAGILRLERYPIYLQEVVERVVHLLQANADDKQSHIAIAVPDDLPAAYADRERVGQMLYNLLKNAVAYTPPGGEIVVRAFATAKMVTVMVCDPGLGIPAESLPFIFERFYRVDRSRARATGGFGLGLAIVKQLAEAHGGEVWAESTPGVGSTFAFTLPIATETEALELMIP
ncbi:MAG: HAMP domain-containing protein [Anaerolineae bacterium]|nr:HAMP domain-containing protein [Anaerolineae bacterium]